MAAPHLPPASRGPRVLLLLVLLVAPAFAQAFPLPLLEAPVLPVPVSAADPLVAAGGLHPGLSEMDVAFALARLARRDASPLEVLAPFRADASALSLPSSYRGLVLDPPPLGMTLLDLARANPGSTSPDDVARLLRGVALPADVSRALSSLGQGVLGAQALVTQGRPLEGAALLQIALAEAGPSLRRHAILLAHRDAFTGLSWDEPGTRARLDTLTGADDATAILRALGFPAHAPEVRPLALSSELAELYGRLGLPLDFETRAALALADSTDPTLRDPLVQALARVRAALLLRDQAFSGLSPEQAAILHDTGAIKRAVASPRPTDADLDLLMAYGAAVEAVDADALRLGMAHLLDAAALLDALPSAGCCATSPMTLEAGGLAVEASMDGGGSVTVRVGPDEGTPSRTYEDARPVFDAERGSLALVRDADGDGHAEETVFETPALRSPQDDVLFADPYGLVVVTGAGSTFVGAHLGGRTVRVDASAVPPAPDASTPLLGALDAFDSLLGGAPSAGAWPWAREEVAEALRETSGDPAPRHMELIVNPRGYQVLHVDLGGGDTYATNAAGAGAYGLLDLWADGAGQLLRPSALRASVPVSLLVDLGGDDLYQTRDAHTLAAANMSLALLVDAQGDDEFRFQGAAHGLASATGAGLALLLGGLGDATYEANATALVHAAGSGTALLLDPAGNDTYQGANASLAVSDLGAHALLIDRRGNDTYRSANFSQGASRGGLALLLDAMGDDRYEATPSTWAQGYAEPARASSLPCPTGAPCPAEPGPARIALLVDAGGADAGACSEGRITNAALGSVALGRAPLAAGPYNPTLGACVDTAADPPLAPGAVDPAGRRPYVDVPPTFFASSFGNFTLPGLARFGTLGPDLVREPYVLGVDLLGDDAYGTGAVATLNASRAGWSMDLGYVGPVSLVVDADGVDLFDAALARGRVPGAFGWADGGVAVQAALASRRVDDARYAPGLRPALRNGSISDPWTLAEPDVQDNRVDESGRLVAPPTHGIYRNVSRGLSAAENHGVAILLGQGVSMRVEAAPDLAPGASCRLACARTGGVALVLRDGGAGDNVTASSYSLGAVDEGPLGGVALYAHRGGLDNFTGSNESMGVVAPFPDAPPVDDPAAGVARAPSVALFIKDGWAQDAYSETMRFPGLARLPRGNERAWEDAATMEGFRAFGSRSLHVARGADNLDWYLNMNLAAADRGVAPGQGSGSPFHPSGPMGEVPERWFTLPPVGPLKAQDQVNRTPVAGPAFNGVVNWTGDDPSASAPARSPGADPGDGGSTTGPYGMKPVTLARTAFSPLANVTAVKTFGAFTPPQRRDYLGDAMIFRATIKNPPAFADVTYGKPIRGAQDNPDGDAIARVELVVKGTSAGWTGCPYPEKADLLEPGACVVAVWDRDVHHPHGNEQVRRHLANATQPQMTEWEIYWNANGAVPGTRATPAFPPGPYVITLRAFADRPDGVPVLTPYGVRDQVLESTFSDALNHTDDRYGLYGGAYHLSLPVYNVPALDVATEKVRDSNGASPVSFSVEVTSPVLYWVNVTRAGAPVQGGRLGPLRSPYADDADRYAADGNDYLNFTWHPGTNPPGRYRATLQYVSTFNPETRQTYTKDVYVDPDAPATRHDPRGVPGGVVTRAQAPDGRFVVPIQVDPTANVNGSRIAGVHLWVQEDLLDAADPSVVLERRPWTYHRFATDLGSMTIPFNTPPGEPTEWLAPRLHGDPFPGPPRVYRVAAYPEDRAGNVISEDPTGTPPPGPDCVAGVCAEYLFDITPPRTRLIAEGAAGELGRIGPGEVVFAIDASETPDAARVLPYVAVVRPGSEAFFEAARLGVDPTPPPAVAKANVSLRRHWETPLLRAPEGLVTAGAPLNLTLVLASLDKSNTTLGYESEEINASRPLWVELEIADDANRTVVGPLAFNVTALAGVPLAPGLNVTVHLPGVHAPVTSGPHRLRLRVDEARSGPHAVLGMPPLAAQLHETFVVWERLPDAEGERIAWRPSADTLQDGNALHVLARGVDRVGNVEEKTEDDLRLVVDLAAPRLVAGPVVAADGFSAALLWETDEACACRLDVLDANGTLVASANTSGTLHEATLAGLFPEETYTYVVRARDALGNEANLTAFNGTPLSFRTGPAIRLTLDPLPALVAAPWNVTWTARKASGPNVTYHLRLSLDGGRTFPENLTGAGLRAFETGEGIRMAALDPARHPESATARLRLDAVPDANPDAVSSVLSATFTLDGHAPTFRFNASGGLGAYAQGPITLNVTALDGGAGVALLEASLDNVTFTPVTGNLTVAGDAPATRWFRAADAGGHVAGPLPLRILLDGRAPSLETQADARGPTSRGQALVEVRAVDPGAGVARVTATENRTRWNVTLPASALAEGRGAFAWPLAAGPEGTRRLEVIAWDAAGNAARQEVVVTVDRRVPSVEATLAEAGVSTATLRVDLDEPASVRVFLFGEGASLAPAESQLLAPGHDVPLSGLLPGATHLALVRATDEAGNEGLAHLVFSTTPDVTRPERVTDLRAESLREGAILLTWRPSEDDDRVAGYRVLRAEADARAWALVDVASSPSFVDDTTTPGLTYVYRVVAVDRSGNLALPSEDLAQRARTAPRAGDLSIEPLGPGLVRVQLTVTDPDGDEPRAAAVVGDRTFPLAARKLDGSTWALEGTVEVPPARILDDRMLHVRVTDGDFETRHPAAGGIRLPASLDESTAPRGILGATREMPEHAALLASAGLVLAMLLVGLRLRRRGRA